MSALPEAAVRPFRPAIFHFATIGALFFAACGASSTPPTNPTATGADGVQRPRFTVMTFNIQHGLNGAGKYGLSAAIDTIARAQPDLVGVQELTRNHAAYNCEDQPAKIADGLSAATGRRWYAVYQQEWLTSTRTCVDSGRGDGVETEGLGLFSPEPLSSQWMQAWNGRIGLMAPLRRGRDVPVTVTHLAHSAAGQSDRMRQLDTILPWSVSVGGSGPRIFLGDFNFSPGTQEYQRIRAEYRDAWEDGMAAGLARGRMDGITHKSSRIDYIFYKPENGIELVWIETMDTGALFGTETSDHRPVIASFVVK